MDEFLSQLDINPKANLDELPAQIARVLSFMHIDQYLEPNANQVRMFLRAALFLYANLEIHGLTLEQKLKEYQQIPKNELNSLLAKFHNKSLVPDVCEKLLKTVKAPNHILEIQDFCSDFLDPEQYVAILGKVQQARYSESIVDRVAAEAKYLVLTTFQLQSTNDIDIAIKRLLDNVQFEVIAWIINFNEQHTYFFMKCLILQKEICSKLTNGLISKNFIASMYEESSVDDNGLSTYLKCLQNKMFANSLMVFVISYLTALEDGNVVGDKSEILKHDLVHVSFLIAVMLSSKSECRIEFHKKLAEMTISVKVLLSISHLNFIYNF